VEAGGALAGGGARGVGVASGAQSAHARAQPGSPTRGRVGGGSLWPGWSRLGGGRVESGGGEGLERPACGSGACFGRSWPGLLVLLYRLLRWIFPSFTTGWVKMG
jgi:hypothetical protein